MSYTSTLPVLSKVLQAGPYEEKKLPQYSPMPWTIKVRIFPNEDVSINLIRLNSLGNSRCNPSQILRAQYCFRSIIFRS